MAPGVTNLPLEAIAEGAAIRSRQAVIIRPAVVAEVRHNAETRVWSRAWQSSKTVRIVCCGRASIHFQIPYENVISVISDIADRDHVLGKKLMLDLKAPFQKLRIVER